MYVLNDVLKCQCGGCFKDKCVLTEHGLFISTNFIYPLILVIKKNYLYTYESEYGGKTCIVNKWSHEGVNV